MALFLVVNLCIAVTVQNNLVQAASKESKALKAYKKELSKSTSTISGNEQADSFCIADTNGDKVPELILYFSGGSQIYLCTYKNNELKCLVEAKYGVDIYPKQHIVYWTYDTGSTPCDYWYKISGGKAKLVAYRCRTIDWSNSDNKLKYTSEFYKVNGKETTKKKYDKYINKIKGKKLKYTLVENTDSNRNKYLK